MVEYRYLGETGVKVSALCLGCLNFGRELDQSVSERVLGHYIDAGGNFLDTANVYSRGGSEEIVGQAIKDRRDDIVLATKVRQKMGDGPNDQGLSRKHIMSQVEGSLRRLQTEYIDLYYLHCWDEKTSPEDTIRTLDDLIRAGKIRTWGISNFTGWQIALAVAVAEREHLARPVAVQPQYSLIVRGAEREVLPAASAFGLAVFPWSPLARGFLTGKYHRGEPPPQNTRFHRSTGWLDEWQRWDVDRNWRAVEAVEAIAERRQKTQAQVALSWLLQRPGVTSPIIGATSLEQLQENLGALDWALADQERADLDAASDFDIGYPYDFIRNLHEDR
jgi:aryl-alcohol dehydrogenase-like predicted oxidoreductase